MDDFLKHIKQAEYDYEHWNQHVSLKNAKNLMQSPLYNKLPIKAKLILYYCQLFYVPIYRFYDMGEEFFNLFDKFEEDFDQNSITDLLDKSFYYTIKIQILYYNSDYEGLKNLEKPLGTILSKLESIEFIDEYSRKILGLFYMAYSRLLRIISNNEEPLTYLLKSLKIWKQLKNYFMSFRCMEAISGYYDKVETEQFYRLNIDYFRNEKKANPLYATFFLISLAEYYGFYDIKIAFNYIEQASDELSSYHSENNKNEDGHFTYVSAYYNSIKGSTCLLMGDIKGSIEANEAGLNLVKLIKKFFTETSFIQGRMLKNLGKAVADSGNLELGLKYQLDALEIEISAYKSKFANMYGGPGLLADCYYQLIQLELQLGQLNEANQYLTKLEILTKQNFKDRLVSNLVLARFKLAKALIYMQKGSFEELVQAKLLLKETIDENIGFELKADAIVPLIDIAIQEYKIFQNDKNYKEIESLIERLEVLGEKNNSVNLKIYSLLLSGKIDLIQGNIGKAEELYKKAINIAKDYNNADLIDKCQIELQRLQKDLVHWGKKLSTSSIKERFDLLGLEDYIKEGQKYLTAKKGL